MLKFVTLRENFYTNPATDREIEFRDTANDVLSSVTYGYVSDSNKFYRKDEDQWIEELFAQAMMKNTRTLEGEEVPHRVVFFIHGLTNSVNQGINQALTYQNLFDENITVVSMHWPSAGFWGANLAVHDASKRSGLPFAMFINKIKARVAKQIEDRLRTYSLPRPPLFSIMAHSMGNMTLGHILNNFDYDFPYFIKQIFLMSAYSPNDAVQNDNQVNGLRFAPYTSEIGVNIYHAYDDQTLSYAALLPQAGGQQLGLTGLRSLGASLNNVRQFDVSRFNNAYDKEYGHDFYWVKPGSQPTDSDYISPALKHIEACLIKDAVCNASLNPINQSGESSVKQFYL